MKEKEYIAELYRKSHVHHCMKSVLIRSYSGPHYPAFGLKTRDMDYLSIFSPNAGK